MKRSPATESIQACLETVENVKTPADKIQIQLRGPPKKITMWSLEETVTVLSGTSIITSTATSSVTPIH